MTIRNKLSRIQADRFLLEMHETMKGVIVYVQADWKHKHLQATRISFTLPVSSKGYASFLEARKAGMVLLVALIKAAQKFPASEGYDGECVGYDFQTNQFTAEYHYEDSPRLHNDYRIQVEMSVEDMLCKYSEELLNVSLDINQFKVGYVLTNKGGIVSVKAPWSAVDVRNKILFNHPLSMYDNQLEKVLMAIIAKFVIISAAAGKFNLSYAADNCRLAYYEDGNYFKATTTNTVVDPTKICRAGVESMVETFKGRVRVS